MYIIWKIFADADMLWNIFIYKYIQKSNSRDLLSNFMKCKFVCEL